MLMHRFDVSECARAHGKGSVQEGSALAFTDRLTGKQGAIVFSSVMLCASHVLLACGEDGLVLVCT